MDLAATCAHDANGRVLLNPDYFNFYICVEQLHAGAGPITTMRTYESTLSPTAETQPALFLLAMANAADLLMEAFRKMDPAAPSEDDLAFWNGVKLIRGWVSRQPARMQEYFEELSDFGRQGPWMVPSRGSTRGSTRAWTRRSISPNSPRRPYGSCSSQR